MSRIVKPSFSLMSCTFWIISLLHTNEKRSQSRSPAFCFDLVVDASSDASGFGGGVSGVEGIVVTEGL